MLSRFHIYQHGKALCHGEGFYIQFEEALGMNPENCCTDCHRRFTNLAKMLKLDWNYNKIDKAVLRGKTEKINNYESIIIKK